MTSKALRLSLRGGGAPQRAGTACGCDGGQVFAFFSNRLGCLGSLVVSLVGTAILVGVLLLLNGA